MYTVQALFLIHFHPCTSFHCAPVANLPPVSTTLAKLVAKFAAGVVDTGGKFAVVSLI